MANLKYVGPYEQVFPLVQGLTSGTLVLTPGKTYDFGDEPAPGPAWWWQPPPVSPFPASESSITEATPED